MPGGREIKDDTDFVPTTDSLRPVGRSVTGCLQASVSTSYKMGQVSLAHSQVTVSRDQCHCVR